MKIKLLAAAVAAVSMAGFAQNSFALANSVTPDVEVFISGASAQDKGIDKLVADLCDANTLTVYKDNGGSTTDASKWGKKHTAWFCTMNDQTVPGLSVASMNVLIHKRSDGGSAQGVSPLLANTAIAHMSINNSNCTTDIGGVKGCRITSTGDLADHASDAGVSDVNPEMFKGLNTPAGFSDVDADAVASTMTVKPAAALVFGVPVSLNFYKALQTAQGLTAAVGCTQGAYNNAAGDKGACMPSMTRQQIATILSGQVKNWSEVTVNGTALTSLVTPPTDTKVHICKRTAGSGTGAQQYAKFLNNPCATSSLEFATSAATGPVVNQMAESGDMEVCLQDWSKGTNSINDAVSGAAINGGLKTGWAIGQQSMEKNANNAKDYRFIKVDGVAPTLQNAFNGSYYDWVESTWQYRNELSGDKLTLVDTIIANASSPDKLATLLNAANSNYDFGKSGFLAVPANGNAIAAVLDETQPVIPYTHAGAGGALDNCTVPVRVRGAGSLPLE